MRAEDQSARITADDKWLAERVRGSDMAAFEALYRAHASGLIGFGYKICGSRDAAQDAVSDVFVRLWERRESWYPQSGLRAYLYTAIRHRLMDQARSERRADERAAAVVNDPSLAHPVLSPEKEAELKDESAALWQLIDSLPPLRRQVMYLRWSRDLSPVEIAEILGINRNAVDKHLSRAMEAIRNAGGSSRDD